MKILLGILLGIKILIAANVSLVNAPYQFNLGQLDEPVSGIAEDVAVSSNTALSYVADNNGLRVIDISDPSNPRLEATLAENMK